MWSEPVLLLYPRSHHNERSRCTEALIRISSRLVLELTTVPYALPIVSNKFQQLDERFELGNFDVGIRRVGMLYTWGGLCLREGCFAYNFHCNVFSMISVPN